MLGVCFIMGLFWFVVVIVLFIIYVNSLKLEFECFVFGE